MESLVDSFLESEEEQLIPTNAKRVEVTSQTKEAGNMSGISYQKDLKKISLDMALVAPYATPDWDQPIKKGATTDPAMRQIFKESSVHPTLRGLIVSRKAPALKLEESKEEPKGAEAPAWVDAQLRQIKESPGMAGFFSQAKSVEVNEDSEPYVPAPAPSAGKDRTSIAESIMSGGEQTVTKIDHKAAAAKNAAAFRKFSFR